MTNLDGRWIRSQFPALQLKVNRRDAIFLDGPGGTQVPQRVIGAVGRYFTNCALSRAIGRELGPGDEVVVTKLDHDANVAPWKALEERGALVREVEIDPRDCTLDMEDLARKINSHKLSAICLAYSDCIHSD